MRSFHSHYLQGLDTVFFVWELLTVFDPQSVIECWAVLKWERVRVCMIVCTSKWWANCILGIFLCFRYLLVLLQATLGVKTVFQHLEVTQLASHDRIEAWGCSPFPSVLLWSRSLWPWESLMNKTSSIQSTARVRTKYSCVHICSCCPYFFFLQGVHGDEPTVPSFWEVAQLGRHASLYLKKYLQMLLASSSFHWPLQCFWCVMIVKIIKIV